MFLTSENLENPALAHGFFMRKGGVSYPEMFKKVKMKLVHQYKAVL